MKRTKFTFCTVAQQFCSSITRNTPDLIKNLRFTDKDGSFNPAAYSAVYNLKTVGKTAGSKSWHVYKPSRSRNLDVAEKADAEIYEVAAQLKQSVSKGAAKPQYDKAQPKQDIV